MFKIISAEIKKSLSKPGIYILSILLAVILILGVFVYNPKVIEDNNKPIEGETFIEKYTAFKGDILTNKTYGIQLDADTKINQAISSINKYIITDSSTSYTQKEYISYLKKQFEEHYENYRECTYLDITENNISSIRNTLVNSLDNLYDAIEEANTKSTNGSFVLLSSEKNMNQFIESYKTIKAYFNVKLADKSNIANYCLEYEKNYKTAFYDALNSFVYPTLKSDFITTYTQNKENSKYALLSSRLNEISNDIETNYNKAKANSEENITLAPEMDKLANLYIVTAETYSNLITYELINNAFNSVSTREQLNIQYLSNYSRFNSQSLLIRYNYLFTNNKTESDYARPLTIGVTSNNDINAYDYAYFVLRLFSFIIISYAIMSACHSIAGEIKEGSMRYLAIRPVNRTKLYLGKLLSIIILSTILSIFSFVIALCVGGAVYGFSSLPILTIFNGKTAVVIQPITMLLVYLFSMIIELTIYASIALFLSSLIKSDLLSVTLILMLYLINTLIPVFVNSPNSWLTYYPFSHISFYSLMGSSVYAVGGNFFSTLLGAKVYTSTNLILTVGMIVLIIAIINLLAIKLFKKKEF